jgi:hypothetical protein
MSRYTPKQEPIIECPVCGDEEPMEFYVRREDLETIGCDCCMREATYEEAEPFIKDDWLYCPVCGEKCDDLYIDKYSQRIVGCEECIEKVYDPFTWAMYYRKD